MSSTGPLNMTWVTNALPSTRRQDSPDPAAAGETPAAPAPQGPAAPPDQSSVASGQSRLMGYAATEPEAPQSNGLAMEWRTGNGSTTAPSGGGGWTTGTTTSPSGGGGLGLEWRTGSGTVTTGGTTGTSGTSGTTTQPSGGGLGLEWRTGSGTTAPTGGGGGTSGTTTKPTGGGGLGLEWKTGTGTTAPTGGGGTSGTTTPPTGGGGLGLEWRTGSGTVTAGGGTSGTTGTSGTKPKPPEDPLAQLRADLVAPLPALPGPASGSDWQQNDLVNRANLIKAIRNDPAIQAAFKDWATLPLDVKEAVGNRISQMQGEIYGFEPSAIRRDSFITPPTNGYYNPQTDAVHVGAHLFNDLGKFLNVLTHEQAHAYQWEKGSDAVQGRMDRSDPLYEIGKQWYDNFFNYVDPADSYAGYRNQPIEAHAWATGDGVQRGVMS